MKNGKDISILDELNNRLDDFFSDDDIIEEKKKINESKSITIKDNPKNNKIQNDKPFDLLRAILLEMDWEINEVNLNKYLDELNVLSNTFSNDRVIYLFLKLLKSLGIYMLYKKSNANPDVLKFLYNSFNCIEKIVINDLTIFDKNLLIIKETEKFKQLKSSMFPNKYKNSTNEFNDNGKKKINFKSLPEEIQKEINDYIENEINAKINELKNRLKNRN